jgi:hypothetical protein
MEIQPVQNISYDDKTHSYTHSITGKLLAGVSSVSELVGGKDKSNALLQWASNEACDYVRTNLIDLSKKDEVLAEAKYAYKNKSTEAKAIGTDVHAILQNIVEARISNRDVDISDNEIGLRSIQQFLEWEKEKKVKWIASELLVGDAEELECAGRLDALAEIDGKITLIDFKVANHIGMSYYIQTAGYSELLRRMGVIVEQRIILRLPKTEKRKVWNGKGYNMVENNLEAIIVPTPLQWDTEVFIKAREIYKYINANIK